MPIQILIVEDETDLLEVLEHRLNKEGYETLGFLSTKNVKRAIAEEAIDLILMDRNLPDIEGSEFIAMLRDQGMQIPVIYLSAKDTPYQINEGFIRGADDYLSKPFEMQELFFRIQAVLRRSQVLQYSHMVTFRDIELDLHSREVTVAKRSVPLSKLEFDLLHIFIESKNTVLQRDYLLKKVWGKDDSYQGRTVNVAINRLKEKIDPDKSKDYIKTVRGVGYSIH